jgi:hypothetical protein
MGVVAHQLVRVLIAANEDVSAHRGDGCLCKKIRTSRPRIRLRPAIAAALQPALGALSSQVRHPGHLVYFMARTAK